MRLATQHDVASIMRPLIAMLAKSPAPQMKFATPIAAEIGVRNAIHEGRGFIFGGYYVMVDVGSDWYTDKVYLIEQIILKIDPEDKSFNVQQIVFLLDTLRERFKADAIVVGDTQIGYMTPIYQAAGYTMLGTQLIKEG